MPHLSTYAEEMNNLFVETLQEVYSAERSVILALPALLSQSSSTAIQKEVKLCIGQAQQQLVRLTELCAILEMKVVESKCEFIDFVFDSVKNAAAHNGDGRVYAELVLSALLSIKNYKIAYYGTLLSWARLLDRNDCIPLLEANLHDLKSSSRELEMQVQSYKDQCDGGSRASENGPMING